MIQVGHGDGQRKNSKTGEDGSYRTAQARSKQFFVGQARKWVWFHYNTIKNTSIIIGDD